MNYKAQKNKIKHLQWNKWNKNNVIPFNKHEAIKLVTKQLNIQHVGHGEMKFAFEVNGKINKKDLYDVDGLGKKWEVKQIDCAKNQYSFRTTIIPNTSVDKFKAEIVEISKQLFSAFCYLNNKQLKLVQKKLNWKYGINSLVDRIREIYDAIVRGNIGKQVIFGDEKQGIIGIKQIIKHISDKLKIIKSRSVSIKINNQNYKITSGQLILIKKVIGIEKIKDEDLLDFMKSCFRHKVFHEINELNRIWNSVNCNEALLQKADYMVVVDETRGFFPLNSKSINKFVKFKRTSGKDANFKFTLSKNELGN